MKNLEIRNEAKKANVKLWQVAEKLGIQDSCFSRLLRHELPQKKKNEILQIISVLQKECETNG